MSKQGDCTKRYEKALREINACLQEVAHEVTEPLDACCEIELIVNAALAGAEHERLRIASPKETPSS